MADVAAAARAGGLAAALAKGEQAIRDAGFRQLDYLAVRDAETLGPYDAESARAGRVLVAAWIGQTRLIDNMGV